MSRVHTARPRVKGRLCQADGETCHTKVTLVANETMRSQKNRMNELNLFTANRLAADSHFHQISDLSAPGCNISPVFLLTRQAHLPATAGVTGWTPRVRHPVNATPYVLIRSFDSIVQANNREVLLSKNSLCQLLRVSAVGLAIGWGASDVCAQVYPFAPVDTSFSTKTVIAPDHLPYSVLFREGDTVYTQTGQSAPARGSHDFIGYVPIDGSSDHGYLFVNHETTGRNTTLGNGGGMTYFETRRTGNSWEPVGKFWNVDFSSVGGTYNNCGGTVSPDLKVFTAEEFPPSSNANLISAGWTAADTSNFTITEGPYAGSTLKRYQNFGFMTMIDPFTGDVTKLYGMGRFSHECAWVMQDRQTVYVTDDFDPAVLFKFVTTTPGDYENGQLYAYKQSTDGATGEWLTMPMQLDSLLIVRDVAISKGATLFQRLEWATEAGGKLYISETGRDSYDWTKYVNSVATVAKHHLETTAVNVDSLSFEDPYGRILEFDPVTLRMRVLLEGGAGVADPSKHLASPDGLYRAYINGRWYLIINEDLIGLTLGRVSAGAAAANRFINEVYWLDLSVPNPTVDDLALFLIGPSGCETTGSVFTPDYSTYFVDIQHPSSSNPTPFNKSATIALTGFQASAKMQSVSEAIVVTPNQEFTVKVWLGAGLNGVADVAGAGFTLHYDVNQLLATGVSGAGIIAEQPSNAVVTSSEIDTTLGAVSYSWAFTNGSKVSGSVPVGMVTFKARPGVTANQTIRLWLSDVTGTTSAGGALSIEGGTTTLIVGDGGVWPGDTDNDGSVDASDVLPIGQNFGVGGQPRTYGSDPDMDWAKKGVTFWTDSTATYADANGDGQVNQNDILPIGLNFGQSHVAAKPVIATKSLDQLQLALPALAVGQKFRIELLVDSGLSDLMGASAQLELPQDAVAMDGVEVGSLLDNGDVLGFQNYNSVFDVASAAFTRKRGATTASGQGEALVFEFTTLAPITAGTAVTLTDVALSFSDRLMRDASGDVSMRFTLIGPTGVEDNGFSLPEAFNLAQNKPNPFNPSTTIAYAIPSQSHVRLAIFNLLGQEVVRLVNQTQAPGHYTVTWDGRNNKGQAVASGLYVYHLEAADFSESKRMTLLK